MMQTGFGLKPLSTRLTLKLGGVPSVPVTPTVTLTAATAARAEGAAGSTFGFVYTITRSNGSGSVLVPWTFSPGTTDAADWVGNTLPTGGTVPFADGETSKTFSIVSAGDNTFEPDETWTVAIVPPSGYAAGTTISATGTLLNDDAAGAAMPRSDKVAYSLFAKDLPVVADNTALATIAESKMGVTWTAPSAAARPKYRTNRMAGDPTIEFTGATFALAGRNAALLDLIGRRHTRMYVFAKVGSLPFDGGGAILGFNNGTAQIDGRVWDTVQSKKDSSGNDTGGIGSAFQTFPFGETGLVVVIRDMATSKTFINGSLVANGNGSGAFSRADTAHDVSLGAARGTTTDTPFGFVGELLAMVMFDDATGWTVPEALQATKWACDRWGQPYPWANITRFLCCGFNSLTNFGFNPGGAYIALLSKRLGLKCGTFANLGQDGAIVADSNENNAGAIARAHLDPIPGVIGKPVLDVFMEYSNRSQGDPNVNAQQVATFLADRRAANASTKNLVLTSTGMTADVDSAGVKTAFGTKRETYNSLIMAQTANIDGKVDISTDTRIGVVGSNREGGDTTYFSDYTHLTGAGQVVMADLIQSEVDRLLKVA